MAEIEVDEWGLEVVEEVHGGGASEGIVRKVEGGEGF
jgi:hypothetical protein